MAKDIKKLHRSSKDKVIFGVCGGLAEYLEVDSLVMRIIFFFSIWIGGAGIFLYIILALLMPQEETKIKKAGKTEEIEAMDSEELEALQTNNSVFSFRNIIGMVIILLGLHCLFQELFRVDLFGWLNWQIILAAILVLIGFKIIKNQNK